MDRYQFGNNLCSLRESHGLTQKELAKKLDVSDKAISKWENGKSMPKFELLEEMSEIFGIELVDLLCISPKNSDYEIERLRLSVSAEKGKSEKIKNTFMWIIAGVVFVSLTFSSLYFILYLITKNENYFNIFKQVYSEIYVELGFISVVFLLKTFVYGIIKLFVSFFRTPSNCVVCENRSGLALNCVHNVVAMFAMFFVFIASSLKDDLVPLTVLYAVIIALLVINPLTQKYFDLTVILSPQGLFKGNIEHGEYHSYSEITDFSSNYEKVVNGLSYFYRAKFKIGKEKFNLRVLHGDSALATEYMGENADSVSCRLDTGIKPWQYIPIALSVVIMFFGFFMFLSNVNIGTKDYLTKMSAPSALTGQTSIVLYNEKIYVYSENQGALNVFEENGKFEYGINIPLILNGISNFFIKNDCIFIVSRWGDKVYKYDSDGNYLGMFYAVIPDEGSKHLCITDKNDKLIQTVLTDDDTQILAYFDDSIIQYEIWDGNTGANRIVTQNRVTDEKTLTDFDNDDEFYEHIGKVLFTPYYESVSDSDGNSYYISFGTLKKNGEAIYKTPFWDWYKNTVFACWATFAFGMLSAAGQVYFYKRLSYKLGYKKLKKEQK